ncbi:MAG: response regulator, partial [Gemmatimonadales bacterium]
MSRVLVIDDNMDVRRQFATTLRCAGHDVAEAENGRDGLALLRSSATDVVIVDILMPEVDGLEVIVTLKTI